MPQRNKARVKALVELRNKLSKGWSLERNKMRTPLHAANVVFVSRFRGLASG